MSAPKPIILKKLSKLLGVIIMGVIFLSCETKKKDTNTVTMEVDSQQVFELPDSLSSRRICFALNLRELVAQQYWKAFNDRAVEGAFNYFNRDKSEIFFPSTQVLGKLENYTKYSPDYITGPRTDSIPYHFELMISFDSSDSSKIYFDHPIQQFLSVEETGDYIPSVKSSEMWTTMVLHEMFHHFQYNNPAFIKYAKQEITSLPYDPRDLQKLCREDQNFFEMIQLENDYLLKAIGEQDVGKRNLLLNSYLQARLLRIERYREKYPYLEKVENYYCTQEGSARYMEYKSMKVLNVLANQANSPSIAADSLFQGYREFKEFDLNKEEFSYLTYAGPSNYHYTIGFNLMRLLDVLEVDYKHSLLSKPEKALHQYLQEYMGALD
ncbi:hypothetical protein [Eudoraea chungangensis]|uniref:hypothetical protein n=1 Tax=Eudoraea chungangensis TaxID=1481905 RepID=UPI0023EB414F|nr:hypothetical protein [Eudoraea chungangensis]